MPYIVKDGETRLVKSLNDLEIHTGTILTIHQNQNRLQEILETEFSQNYLINGCFQIWQDGIPITATPASGVFAADRWSIHSNNTGLNCYATQKYYSEINLPCLRYYLDSSADLSTLTNAYSCIQYMAEMNDAFVIYQPFTISFWCKSNLTGVYTLNVNAFQVAGDATTRVRISRTFKVEKSDTWEFKTIDFPAYTGGMTGSLYNAGFSITFVLDASPDRRIPISYDWDYAQNDPRNAVCALDNVAFMSNANNYFELAGVDLYPGHSVQKLKPRPYGIELLLCQRYYEKSFFGNDPTAYVPVQCEFPEVKDGFTTTIIQNFQVRKRTIPSVTLYSASTGAAGYVNNESGDLPVASVTVSEHGIQSITLGTTTTYDHISYHYVADARMI